MTRRRGATHGANVSFVLEMEDLRVCHLGDLGHTPTPDQVEEMSDVSVLLIPVGGNTTIDGATAAEVVNIIEPAIVIPMHYRTEVTKDELAPLDRFLKEMGAKDLEPQPNLALLLAIAIPAALLGAAAVAGVYLTARGR